MSVQQEPRISQLIPTIKCSDCGETVEFRRLGEHLCQGAPAVPALPSSYKNNNSNLGNSNMRMDNMPNMNKPSNNFNSSLSVSNNSNENLNGSIQHGRPLTGKPVNSNYPTPHTSSSTVSSSSSASKEYFDNDRQLNNQMITPPIQQSPPSPNHHYQQQQHYQAYGGIGGKVYPNIDPDDMMTNQIPPPQQSPDNHIKKNYNKDKSHKNGNVGSISSTKSGSGFDDLMEDLLREMDNMQTPSQKIKDICAYCNKPIGDSSPLWALGKSWHSHHLLCAECKKPINPDIGHVEKEGRVYCPDDFTNLFLPKCRRCKLPVQKEAITASDGKLEGKWHVTCFGCHNAPYCKRHYHKLNNSLCRKCDQPIEGPCAQTDEGWRYHPGCFVCYRCQYPLTDVYYIYDNEHYCETHIMEIQQRQQIRAEKRQTMFRNIS
ncbi:10861_t:CDS:10 [Diversispora eburnea]|uniref:10861_t:CDS:1 n=1 Tax=Diversispora eburnea TaxID=1213867 RepID=A0A9N9AAW3_9GLOM|nr:10861_t:CDS:10 [Diversispora eburnea]